MVKIPTYESQVGIGSANAGQAARYQSRDAFVSAGDSAMPQALSQLAEGMDKLSGVMFNEEIRKRQEQLELDLMKDVQGVHAATSAFQDEYTSAYKGADARDAAQQAAAFNEAQLGPLREKYGHNKTALSYIERHGGELALANVNAMRDYGTRQGELYKDSVFAGEQALAKNALADWRTPPDAWRAKEADIRAKTIGYAQSKGLDLTAAGAQYDAFVGDALATRERGRLEHLVRNDPEEAGRYIRGNAAGGESGGELARILPAHEVAAWGARADAAVEHRRKALFDQETGAMYGELHARMKDMPERERQHLATDFIAGIKDADARANVASRYKADEALFEEQYQAGQLARAKSFREEAEAEGLSPSQALQRLELAQGMDAPTREKLRKRYNGERNVDTHGKKVAAAEIRAMIDDGKVTRDGLDALMLEHNLPEQREKDVYAYFDAGGQAGKHRNVPIARVQAAYRDVTGNRDNKLDIDTYEAVAGQMPPGKEPTYQDIRQAVARMTVQGSIPGAGWFGMDKSATYHEASQKGEGAGWLPEVTREERREIAKLLAARGDEPTGRNIALFKKHEIWGIPAEGAEGQAGKGAPRSRPETLKTPSGKE